MRTMIVCTVLSLLWIGCGEKIKPTVLPEIDSKVLPLQESWNSTITISDSGIVKAIIHAGYIRVYEEPRRTHLSDGVKVDFYNEEGVKTSILNSLEASVNDITNNLEAWGEVVVISESDNTVLRTERLFWDNRLELIHTPEFVRIVSPNEKIQGTGFEAKQNLQDYKIFKVSGETQSQ